MAGTETDQMDLRCVNRRQPFDAAICFARALLSDGWIFVAGTTGYDHGATKMLLAVERNSRQCANPLRTIQRALSELGASLDDVVRIRYILPDPADWPACWPLVSKAFSRVRPAATRLPAGLQSSEMKIEIEVTGPCLGLQVACGGFRSPAIRLGLVRRVSGRGS